MRMTDEEIINAIRIVLGSIVFVVCAILGIIYGPEKTFVLYVALTGQHEKEQEHGLPICRRIFIYFAALCVFVNTVMRFLIKKEKSKGRQEVLSKKTPPYSAYIIVLLIVMLLALSTFVTFFIRRFVVLFIICVALSGFVVSKDKKMSELLIKSLKEKIPKVLAMKLSNKIGIIS